MVRAITPPCQLLFFNESIPCCVLFVTWQLNIINMPFTTSLFHKEILSCHGRGGGMNVSLFKCLFSVFIHSCILECRRDRFCPMREWTQGIVWCHKVPFTWPDLCRIILKLGTMSIFRKAYPQSYWKGMFTVSNTSELSTVVRWQGHELQCLRQKELPCVISSLFQEIMFVWTIN